MLTIIKSYSLPEEFPDAVLAQAEKTAAADSTIEQQRRIDLTHEITYTIDPSDAKDHDDAISISKTKNGFSLGVHIADVSYYVAEGTDLDKEAFARGNSVYLPGMVIPMIPEVLSNNVCSLRPNRKRLTHSVIIHFDERGKAIDWQMVDTIIRSRAKLSYEEVQDYFDNKTLSPGIKRVSHSLDLARQLAKILTNRRTAEGSLDFDLPDAMILLNKKGEVLELGDRIRLESHRLVEEFMLAANRIVALEIARSGQPFLYRVHAKPSMEKLKDFATTMKHLGHRFPLSEHIKPIQYARFLKKIRDLPEADFINELLLRSMQKALYQSDNIGHFGLAFTHYTHFTSPIRRYPDLLVHRLIRKMKNARYPVAYARKLPKLIEQVCKHCSETERLAEAAEREAVRTKQVSFMAKHVGDQFTGVISGTMGYGFFVRLDNMGVEGFVRLSAIDDDYYHYDEQQYRIIGHHTGRSFRMGDPVKVAVSNVNQERKEIDLFLVDDTKNEVSRRKKHPGKRQRKRRRRY
jgi:ribonuclease R